MTSPKISSLAARADFELRRAWTDAWFSSPENLPVVFEYGGKTIRGIPANWGPRLSRRRIDANLDERVYTGRDPAGAVELRVEFLTYVDHPVIEWQAWLYNVGAQPSELVANLQALDADFAGGEAVLWHCNGDFYSVTGYTPSESALTPGESLRFAPTGGRPSDGAFPYYRVKFADSGLSLAVGWPGQWAASFSANSQGVRIRAGQEKTHLRLLPGEQVRTPRVTLLAWQGTEERAINLWRRWYLAHVLPKPDGKPLGARHACAATEDGEEFTNATEENQIRLMKRFKDKGLDFDVWWIDAGWYPCRAADGKKMWWHTGTWEPEAERFPRGFAPVSQSARALGAELLVWFEPERVYAGSKLDRERPEWLLRTKDKGGEPDMNRLLDLGNPECQAWLTEHVNKLIAQGGIGIYRQDFNFPPLDYWRDNDAEERQGMHENLHVQGYLRYWDELLQRNPGLWIDSCSSGGRRNDLETMRRSVPLHYTDYGYGDHAVKLAFHRTLYEWIPYFKECTLSWDVLAEGEDRRFDALVDSFAFHCGLAAMLFTTLDIRRDDHDYGLGARMVGLWREAVEYILHGDYYALTPFSKESDAWVVWQFDRPEEGCGMVQGIRLQDSPQDSFAARLHGLDPAASYRFENHETGEQCEVSGAELAAGGFSLRQAQRSGAIWFYKRG